MKKIFSAKIIILLSLISSLGVFLGGCRRSPSLFSRLNGAVINIKPDDKKWGRWISNHKNQKNNQLSYLVSCINKQFHLNNDIYFQLKNGRQYLDPNKTNTIKFLLKNFPIENSGSFSVTWPYTLDQKRIFDLYRKLKKIPPDFPMTIVGRTTDYKQPIHLQKYINQVRNAIKKAVPEINDNEKSMIHFSTKTTLKFGTTQDIFPELYLSKNSLQYSFKKNGALGEKTITPKLKVRWYNRHLLLLSLKDRILTLDDTWWGKTLGFPFDMNVADYADDQELVYELLFNDVDFIPEDLYQYFSLSHIKLIEDVTVPATLYFNKNNEFKEKVDNIVFERTIWIRGLYL